MGLHHGSLSAQGSSLLHRCAEGPRGGPRVTPKTAGAPPAEAHAPCAPQCPRPATGSSACSCIGDKVWGTSSSGVGEGSLEVTVRGPLTLFPGTGAGVQGSRSSPHRLTAHAQPGGWSGWGPLRVPGATGAPEGFSRSRDSTDKGRGRGGPASGACSLHSAWTQKEKGLTGLDGEVCMTSMRDTWPPGHPQKVPTSPSGHRHFLRAQPTGECGRQPCIQPQLAEASPVWPGRR